MEEAHTPTPPLSSAPSEGSTNVDIKALNEKIQKESSFVTLLTMEMDKVIIGQKHMTERLLIGLLSNGHILLEGVPGLAKTLAINTLAKAIDAKFSRVQFTPDLLPADGPHRGHRPQAVSHFPGLAGARRRRAPDAITLRRDQGFALAPVSPRRLRNPLVLDRDRADVDRLPARRSHQ